MRNQRVQLSSLDTWSDTWFYIRKLVPLSESHPTRNWNWNGRKIHLEFKKLNFFFLNCLYSAKWYRQGKWLWTLFMCSAQNSNNWFTQRFRYNHYKYSLHPLATKLCECYDMIVWLCVLLGSFMNAQNKSPSAGLIKYYHNHQHNHTAHVFH